MWRLSGTVGRQGPALPGMWAGCEGGRAALPSRSPHVVSLLRGGVSLVGDCSAASFKPRDRDAERRARDIVQSNLMEEVDGLRVAPVLATDADLERVRRACVLDKFVRSLPHGFDTALTDSTGISAGQKQMLTIARAMLQNSPMLILDEATSSVGTRTELIIQRAMDQLMQNRTSFVIAHRLSTIRDADMILVMNGGDIVERGTHDELLAKEGKYYELWNMQQGIYRSKKAEPKQYVMQAVVEEDDDGESITY